MAVHPRPYPIENQILLNGLQNQFRPPRLQEEVRPLEKEMQKLRNQSNLAAKDEMEDHPEEALELKEIEKLKDEFDDKDFV